MNVPTIEQYMMAEQALIDWVEKSQQHLTPTQIYFLLMFRANEYLVKARVPAQVFKEDFKS